MNRAAIVAIIGSTCLLAACASPEPTAVLPVFGDAVAYSVLANGGASAAVPMSGANEVPSKPTRARGTAVFHLSDDGTSLHYKLIVADIENAVQSHIHIAPPGVNGPAVVFLYGPAPAAGGRADGILAEGTITAANLIGPLAGMTLADLMAAMQSGNAYVNVHTNDGVAPTDTGPGDFPGGEIRGQVR